MLEIEPLPLKLRGVEVVLACGQGASQTFGYVHLGGDPEQMQDTLEGLYL